MEDFGRAKSQYFFAQQLQKPIIDYPFIGKLIGKVSQVGKDWLKIDSQITWQDGLKIRIMDTTPSSSR